MTASLEILSSAFERLREGDTFVTPGRTVTEADVVAFAAYTGDLHPRHVDAHWAAGRPPGERVAPGMLTLSYALGLVRADPERALALRSLTDVVFTRPVRIGDTISVSGRISALTPVSADTGSVRLTLLTSNHEGRTVCRARVEMLWRRDDGGDAANPGAET